MSKEFLNSFLAPLKSFWNDNYDMTQNKKYYAKYALGKFTCTEMKI